jgi:hypothetical protein
MFINLVLCTTTGRRILAYIKAVRYLHALTGDKVYLEHMKDAISYEVSFKFCYNSPIQVAPLSKLGWSSCRLLGQNLNMGTFYTAKVERHGDESSENHTEITFSISCRA